MKELCIIISDEELTISKKHCNVFQELVHEYSEVPTKRNESDKEFYRLREIALNEWYKRCGEILRQFFNCVEISREV